MWQYICACDVLLVCQLLFNNQLSLLSVCLWYICFLHCFATTYDNQFCFPRAILSLSTPLTLEDSEFIEGRCPIFFIVLDECPTANMQLHSQNTENVCRMSKWMYECPSVPPWPSKWILPWDLWEDWFPGRYTYTCFSQLKQRINK